MDLYKELKPHEKPDFLVVERDLSHDPEIQKKETFSKEDRFVDYSLETQREKGGIVVPVFRSERLSVSRSSKMLDYEITPLGCGVWKLTTLVGSLVLNQHDTSFTKERFNTYERYFVYRKEIGGFILIENKDCITKELEPVLTLKKQETIRNILHEFEEVLYPRMNRGEHSDVLLHRKQIDLYHYVLHVVFNYISKRNYELISSMLSRYDKLEPYTRQMLFERSIWVDADGSLHRSIGEIQCSQQPSELFRTRHEKRLLSQLLRTKRKEGKTIFVHLTSQYFPSEFERFKTTRK